MTSIVISGLILATYLLYGMKHRSGPFIGIIANFLFAGAHSRQPEDIGYVVLGVILVFVNLWNFVSWSKDDEVE